MTFQNRRISIRLGKTISTGNFESLRVDVEVSADIQDDKELGIYQEDLFNTVKAELDERVEELTPKKNALPRGKAATKVGDYGDE